VARSREFEIALLTGAEALPLVLEDVRVTPRNSQPDTPDRSPAASKMRKLSGVRWIKLFYLRLKFGENHESKLNALLSDGKPAVRAPLWVSANILPLPLIGPPTFALNRPTESSAIRAHPCNRR